MPSDNSAVAIEKLVEQAKFGVIHILLPTTFLLSRCSHRRPTTLLFEILSYQRNSQMSMLVCKRSWCL